MPEYGAVGDAKQKQTDVILGGSVSSTSFHLGMLLGFIIAYDDAYDRQQARREKSIIALDNRF